MKTRILPLGSDSGYASQAFDLITGVFVERSTLHQALGVGLHEYRSYLWPSFQAMVGEGLSIMTVDQTSGAVVGCLMATDFHPHLAKPDYTVQKLVPLVALTTKLCEQYQQYRSISPGEVVLVDMAAIATNAGGAGLYQKMRDHAQNRAQQRGYRHVVGELSSTATQHVILEKLQHQKISEIAFCDFEWEGVRPFADILAPASIVLAEGRL